jgi:hypothetical protein
MSRTSAPVDGRCVINEALRKRCLDLMRYSRCRYTPHHVEEIGKLNQVGWHSRYRSINRLTFRDDRLSIGVLNQAVWTNRSKYGVGEFPSYLFFEPIRGRQQEVGHADGNDGRRPVNCSGGS